MPQFNVYVAPTTINLDRPTFWITAVTPKDGGSTDNPFKMGEYIADQANGEESEHVLDKVISVKNALIGL